MRTLASLLALWASGALAAPIANGDFERGLEGWSPVKPAEFANGDITAVTDDVHAGRQALRILNPPGEKVLTGAITGFLPLPAEARAFEIRLWMKSVVAAQTMELRLAAMDTQGQALVPYTDHGWAFLRPPVGDSVGKWTEFSAMFLAQPDWGGVQLTVWVNGANADVRFDDIRLPSPVNGVALWTEGPLRKVYPDAEPPAAASGGLDLAAPGDAHDVAQLCLRADRAVKAVSVSFAELSGPGKLPASAWQANWVGLVPVTKRMNVWSLLGPTPDPLLTDPVHDLAPGETWAIWLTVHVPRGTAKGVYRGSVRLALDGTTVQVPVQVRVYGFDLPERPRLRTMARVWQHHPDDLQLFYRDLQEHRANSSGSIGGISVRLVDGKMTVDTAGVKAAAEEIRALGSQAHNVPNIYLGDWSGVAGLGRAARRVAGPLRTPDPPGARRRARRADLHDSGHQPEAAGHGEHLELALAEHLQPGAGGRGTPARGEHLGV
ncbi:MAG: hypothetical protein HYU66_10720 [Armatimonadetes bacterium]|nr:hypothetical protein [Armatimonadota bacterium]